MTPTQRLAALLLEQPLADYVATKRLDGQPWASIAADLSLDTGGAVDVSRETLRLWFGDKAAA